MVQNFFVIEEEFFNEFYIEFFFFFYFFFYFSCNIYVSNLEGFWKWKEHSGYYTMLLCFRRMDRMNISQKLEDYAKKITQFI